MTKRMGFEADAAIGWEAADCPDERDARSLPAAAIEARQPFALAAYLSRWAGCAHHDLAASDSQALPLASLLRLAEPDDLRRWRGVGLGYADPRGAPWLRTAIAARYAGLGADDVLASAGAQEAVACVLRGLLGPEDHALVVVPIYQPSELVVTSLCPASGVPLDPNRGWSLDLDRVAAAIRANTRLLLVNFPNSPTGATVDRATLGDLVSLCRRHGIWLVNDEVYRQTEPDRASAVPPVAELYERGVSINGLSKGFGLPGLRVGWVACRNRGALDKALAAKSLLSSCLTGPGEILAHVALRAEARITGWTRAIGRRNRRRLHAMLDHHPGLFEPDESTNLAFGFARFRGSRGAAGFAKAAASELGLLVPHSGLWRSALAPVPADRLRLGLGRIGSGAALGILEDHLLRLADR